MTILALRFVRDVYFLSVETIFATTSEKTEDFHVDFTPQADR